MKTKLMLTILCLVAVLIAVPLWAAEEESNAELAKKLQNPIADLISIPFQNNVNLGYGPDDNTQNILNIQPVIPFHITKDWNLITRTIIPLIWQPWPEKKFGMGDIQESLFFSPNKMTEVGGGRLMWGVGPILNIPTATSDAVGSNKFGAGPTAVGVYMKGPWVVGTLINNVWASVGDSDDQKINQMLIQPFVNFNFPKAWYLTFSPIITANWKADKSSDIWTVPLGGGVGKVFRIGKLPPMNVQVSSYYNVAKPDLGPDWQLRLQLAIILPTSLFKGK
jgi:hypothetical protein